LWTLGLGLGIKGIEGLSLGIGLGQLGLVHIPGMVHCLEVWID